MNTRSILPQNRFFKLPFVFDTSRLLTDLATCSAIDWPVHYNQSDFIGKWSSIALRSLSGKETDVRALPGVFADTDLLGQCPYFQGILAQFCCEKEAVRLLALAPGARIHEHRDFETCYEYGLFRIHVPIQTGNQVTFRVDGETLPMLAGECWYANFDLLHSVQNDGPIDRVHLVIDCRRNTWSDDLFAQAGYDFSAEKQKQVIPPDVRRRMIAELTLQDTDVARKLIAELEKEA